MEGDISDIPHPQNHPEKKKKEFYIAYVEAKAELSDSRLLIDNWHV
jgi:hypothetical protein